MPPSLRLPDRDDKLELCHDKRCLSWTYYKPDLSSTSGISVGGRVRTGLEELCGPRFGFTLPFDAMLRLEEANLARAERRFDAARTGIREILRRLHTRPEVGLGAHAIAMLGICEIAAGAYGRGVTLLAAASTVEGPIGTIHVPDVRVDAPMHLEMARRALGEVAYTSVSRAGHCMTLDQVRTHAAERQPDNAVEMPAAISECATTSTI